MTKDEEQVNSDKEDAESGVTKNKVPRLDTDSSPNASAATQAPNDEPKNHSVPMDVSSPENSHSEDKSTPNKTGQGDIDMESLAYVESIQYDSDYDFDDDSDIDLYDPISENEVPIEVESDDENFAHFAKSTISLSSTQKSGTGASSGSTVKSPPNYNFRPISAPLLTPEMLSAVDDFVAGKISMRIPSCSQIGIKPWEVECLGTGEWLTDNVVDYYLELMAHRNKDNPSRCAKVFMFPSTFYPLLETRSRRYSARILADNVEMFQHEWIFFPVCVSQHWRLIVAEVACKTVTPYNSVRERGDKIILKRITKYLNKFDPQNTKTWEVINVSDVPQQGKQNDEDCGVFISQFADYLSRRMQFDFADEYMPYFRKKMFYECLCGRLLT